MNISMFIILLAFFSAATSLITEAVKKYLDDSEVTYAANSVVLIIALIIGIVGTAVAYIFMGIAFTPVNVIVIPLMALANWLVAMLGYDKVIQMIEQLGSL